MPLETATYINDLVVTNPANSDGLNQADDHMRLIKAVLKNTFPNFTAVALSSTQAQLDAAVAAVVTRPDATVKPGFIMDYAGTAAPAGWLECNGAAVSRTTFSALFTAIGTTWGAGDGSTTFNLPPDRYRVGRNTAAAAVGTLQASQNKSHTHTASGNTGGLNNPIDHLHPFSGNTGTESAQHNHNIPSPAAKNGTSPGGSAFFGVWNNGLGGDATVTSGVENQTHTHGFSGNTGAADRSLDHTHPISLTTSGGSADGTEARPLSATYLTCIKT